MGPSGSNMNQYNVDVDSLHECPSYRHIIVSQVVDAGASTKCQITVEDAFLDATIRHNIVDPTMVVSVVFVECA